ncbi:HEPN domain-containing protein [Streptomyces sp. S1]|uniref:HEPN domain-containing protein n=1 Tax=Streptomyces sp. S1 TaxID=718288 RepID=UPI0013CE5DD9|nr:HEPN domain-containing protein [Streptomyces sp. S1]
MYLNAAWRRCSERFDEVASFIDVSAAAIRMSSDPSIRSDLYGSWVLLTYASCQFALHEIGKGCMLFLGERYSNPSRMPEQVLRAHEKMSFEAVRRLSDGDLKDKALVRQALQNIYSKNWASHSPLLKIERNVWPDNVREWMKRLGINDGDLAWMSQPASDSSETYASRLSELVSERNPIAHGDSPSRLLSAPLMKDWLTECRGFMENCCMSASLHLSREHKPRLRSVGVVDRKVIDKLGKSTIPILKTNVSVRVGDHVLLADRNERKKIARIESIKSSGKSHDEVPVGFEAVAFGLNKPHQGCGVYLTP